MARGATYREKTPSRKRWTEEDKVELLAYLDFFIWIVPQERVTDRKAEILRKLQSKISKRRNQKQIEGKLLNVWNVNGDRGPGKKFEDVYYSGTTCMTRIDPLLLTSVQKLLKSIEGQYASTPMTRSASRNLGIDTSRSKRNRTIVGEHTPTDRVQKKQRRDYNLSISKTTEIETSPRKVRKSPPNPRILI